MSNSSKDAFERLKIDPEPQSQRGINHWMMKLFLDSLLKFAIAKPDSLTLYTQKMALEMDELLAGVVVDEDE